MMIGKIFITSRGYDPELGKHVKDPYLGPHASLGACRPDVRERIAIGGHIFVISGKVPNVSQFIMGGFEVAEKIHAREAFERFPEHRLRIREDGQLDGNIIVDAAGKQHPLDNHESFDKRASYYVVGTNVLAPETPTEIALAREQTLDVLRKVLGKTDGSPWKMVGHYGSDLTENQVRQLKEWLLSLKEPIPTTLDG
jgi:hypothetical protein